MTLEDLAKKTKEELLTLAREMKIKNRSKMTKNELKLKPKSKLPPHPNSHLNPFMEAGLRKPKLTPQHAQRRPGFPFPLLIMKPKLRC